MMFIGMSKIPHQGSMKNTPQAIASKTEDERRIKQAQHEQVETRLPQPKIGF